MAYRRRQQNPPPPSISTPGDELYTNSTINFDDSYGFMGLDRNESNLSTSTGGSSLATRAIRASSGARRDSSLSSAYAFNSSSYSSSLASNSMASATSTTASSKDSPAYEYTSMKSMNDSKQGFWSSLARKAKSILDDDDPQQMDSPRRNRQDLPNAARVNYKNEYPSPGHQRKVENPKLQKGLHAISSSLNYIGNAVEEGLTIVENRTADLIQGTRNHIKKKPGADAENQSSNYSNSRKQTHLHTQGQQQTQTDLNLQLKASRDVAMAMAAKAKLLLRELKTVKADLAFAKERCAQLEDENKILRENHGRGDHPDDDDLIRLQLETLLAEKARLAHENSIFARENRFLREVVEYHQLTMQDVVYFDEGTEEVTEVYPIKVVTDETFDKSVVVDKASPPVPVPPPGLSQAFKK